ncbi:hypothetical protein D3C81_1817300 [compost metagenome]
MDDLVGVLCLGVGVATWWWLAGRMKKRGSGWLTRQVAGSFACCFMAVAIAHGSDLVEAHHRTGQLW